MLKKHPWLVIILASVAATILFHSSLNYYFFQDDWFVLDWVKNQNPLSFFEFRTDIIYWRPLSMPLLFFTLNKLFALNSFAFHSVVFLMFFALIFSVYKLFLEFFQNKKSAIIATFLYGTWSIHYISLSWLSTTSYILGPLFQTWCFFFFLKHERKKRKLDLILSFLFFLAALASSEFTVVLPAIIFFYFAAANKKLNFVRFIPFALVCGIYLFLRFVLFPAPAKGDYQPGLNLGVVYNYIWYVLWSFNVPESFKSLIYISQPKRSLEILLQFWQISLSCLLTIILFAHRAKANFNLNYNYYLLGAIWFLVGLLPVIFLKDHSYPVYLSFSGIGLLLIFAKILENTSTKYTIAFLVVWMLATYWSTNFTKSTHWIRNEQAISKSYTQYVLKKIVNPNPNSVFIFRPANTDFSQNNHFSLPQGVETIKLSLNYDSAVKVIYKDPSLKSLFLPYTQNIDLPPKTAIYDIDPLE